MCAIDFDASSEQRPHYIAVSAGCYYAAESNINLEHHLERFGLLSGMGNALTPAEAGHLSNLTDRQATLY